MSGRILCQEEKWGGASESWEKRRVGHVAGVAREVAFDQRLNTEKDEVLGNLSLSRGSSQALG